MTTTRTSDFKTVPNINPTADNVAQAEAAPELIRRHITDDQICILTFDRPDSAANIFEVRAAESVVDLVVQLVERGTIKDVRR